MAQPVGWEPLPMAVPLATPAWTGGAAPSEDPIPMAVPIAPPPVGQAGAEGGAVQAV